MTNGGVDADFSLGITQGSDVRVSGLSISGGGSGGVMVTGEGTRAVLTDLRVSDWGRSATGSPSEREPRRTSPRAGSPTPRPRPWR
ncbi:hypothetical protein KGD82_24635 [Nocardiopsis eucommiae]|uniref:Uncharacterized protein n=1 Tax=Nocardiopsis eucommiae TaxID=2831970 RepID=A0A975L9P4_9ACTN|nr:hypothetical protein KGD82_24635 [Nocardiopsis eucommiae]